MTELKPNTDGLAVSPSDIEAAAERIAAYVMHTPLLTNAHLDERTGARVFVKPECLQHTGAFKFRGAMNSLLSLAPEIRTKGVLAWSSGNHGQAVARAAKILGVKATIVMPADAPKLKLDATRAHGAEVVTYDRFTEIREEIGRAIAQETGATIIPPFDYAPTIAGQGTAGYEIVTDLSAQGAVPGVVLCPCGGGGLVSGISLAVRSVWPECQVHAVEPEGFDDTRRSLAAGMRTGHDPGSRSICDALQSPMPGELTFPIQHRLLAGAVTVSDEAVLCAMAFAFRHLKLVVEPGGAVALAALLEGAAPVEGKTVVVVLSGGNVDADVFARALTM